MIESKVSEFLQKAEEYKQSNPNTILVWQVTEGTLRRNRKIVPPGAQNWPETDADLFDELLNVVEPLIDDEDVDRVWMEAREHNRSKVCFYVHIKNENKHDSVVSIDRSAAGVLATQLVETNKQLVGLLNVKERMLSHLSQKMFDTGIQLRQIETERYMEQQFGQDQSMAEAIKALTPMLGVALAKWANQSNHSSKSPDTDPPQSYPVDEQQTEDTDIDAERLTQQIEWICENRPELLTDERVQRIFNAFTQSK